MKEKEARVDYPEHQLILYVEKKDGSYGPLQTGSYITSEYLDDFWAKKRALADEYLAKIRRGEASPIAYHMILEELAPAELAARVGISTRKVLRHLEPRHFGTMSIDLLKRYCEVFDVSLGSMFQLVASTKKDLKISEEKTENPLFTILRIEETRK